MENTFSKFTQFAKLEETDKGPIVWGIATLEAPDLDNEVCQYDDAVDAYKSWSDATFARTSKAGQELSLGNIRLQHGLEIGGKVTKIEYDDADKRILLGTQPFNDDILSDLRKGYYTGYSQGGSYAWRKCSDCGKSLTLQQANNYCPACKKNVTVLFGLKRISEVSYVDSPATGVGFEHVKSDGTRSVVKFAKRSELMAAGLQLTAEKIEQIAAQIRKDEAKTKRVASVSLTVERFAYVGDADKTSTWKLPIDFPGDDEKTKKHIRNALARFGSTKGIPDDKKAEVKAKIVAAAKKHGIDVDDEGNTKAVRDFIEAATAKATGAGFEKGLYAVGRLADVLQTMAYLYSDAVYEREMEGDDSEVPEDLKDVLEHLIEIFIASATEEAKELAANKADINKGGATMTPEEKDALEKAAKKSLATHFAKSAVHHEKLAKAHHEQAEAHDSMCDECKADGGESGSELHKALGKVHKSQSAFHTKCAKAHESQAEHLNKMAESHDKEEAEKTVKAEREASGPAAVQKNDSADDFATRLARKAEDELLNDPAFLAKVKAAKEEALLNGIVDKTITDEIQKRRETTLAPDGVKLTDASGLRVVQRTTDTSFKLATSGPAASDAGI